MCTAVTVRVSYGRAGQDRAGEDRAGQGRAAQNGPDNHPLRSRPGQSSGVYSWSGMLLQGVQEAYISKLPKPELGEWPKASVIG